MRGWRTFVNRYHTQVDTKPIKRWVVIVEFLLAGQCYLSTASSHHPHFWWTVGTVLLVISKIDLNTYWRQKAARKQSNGSPEGS